VFFEKGKEFFGEGGGAMVFGLGADVGGDGVELRDADGEGGIFLPPGEGSVLGECVVDPF